MSSIGSLEIDLLLESSSFLSGMKKAQTTTAEAAVGIQESLAGIREESATLHEAADGLAAAFAVDFLAEKVQSALEYSEAIKKVSEATGTSTTFVQQFTFAAGQAGVSTDTATAALEKFTVSLGKGGNANQKTLKTLSDLGVTSTDTKTAMLQLADGLEKVPTEAQKAADIVAVFGKGALSLLPALESLAGDGFGNLAKQVESLGVILDGQVIEGAVNAEHKITALKTVISADWANVIGQNATQIENLADALIKLTAAAASFASTKVNQGALFDLNNPDLVRLKNLVTGGDTGAQLSADSAQLMGSAQGRSMLLDRNTSQLNDLKMSGNGPAVGSKLYNQERNSLLLQRKSILAADVAKPEPTPTPSPTGVLPPLKQPKTRDRAPHQQATFDKQMGTEQQNQYSLEEQLAVDPLVKNELQKKQISYDYGNFDMSTGTSDQSGQKDKEIDDEVNTKKITAAQGDELKAELDKIGWLKISVANRQLDAQQSKDALALTTADITNQEDILNGSLALARTSEQKKEINDKLIDLSNQQVEAQLDAIIASKDSTATEIQIAQARKALLPQLTAQSKAKNVQDNSGPIATYLNAMPQTVGEIGESLQTAAVTGLGSLTTGIEAAINGTGSLKSAFSSLASSIVTDLEKIVIEEEIVKPLANLLTGGSSGGGGLLGGLAKGLGSALGLGSGAGAFSAIDATADSSISSVIAANPLVDGWRANGGMTQPGNYLVGERGPEMVSIGAPASVTTNRNLDALQAGGGGGGVTINSTVSGVNDPAMVKRLSAQTLWSAAPALLSMSADNTNAKQRQRKMR